MRIPAGVFSADGHGVLARRLRHDAEAARRQPLAGINRLTVLRGDGHVDAPAVTLDVHHDFLAFRHNQRGRVFVNRPSQIYESHRPQSLLPL